MNKKITDTKKEQVVKIAKSQKKFKTSKLTKMPYIETKFEKSQDGKYLVHKTIITTIRSLAYFEKILEEDGETKEVAPSEDVEIVTGSAIAA